MTLAASPTLSIARVRALLDGGELTPTELVELVLERIEERDPAVQAWAHVDVDGAREQARSIEREADPSGALRGLPIGIKDVIDVAGMPTRCGSTASDARPARRDAAAVERLRRAGAIVIGKTHTHELACGSICPPTRNARDHARIPGGSSGGSAVAVATGTCAGAIGTDTNGSIRQPAAFNGVVGLKPTLGVVPSDGVTPLSWGMDHVGPIAATVDDAALLFRALALTEPTESEPAGGGAMRIGWVVNSVAVVREAELEAIAEAALRRSGAAIVPVTLPMLGEAFSAALTVTMVEASAAHGRLLHERANQLGDDVREILRAGEVIPSERYVQAQRVRVAFREAVWTLLSEERLDAFAHVTVPVHPPLIGTATATDREGGQHPIWQPLIANSSPWSLTGQPAITVPCGDDARGLPVGLTIAGRPHEEERLFAIARACEAGT